MKVIFDVNKTGDGHTLNMGCLERPDDALEVMELKTIIAQSLLSETASWSRFREGKIGKVGKV